MGSAYICGSTASTNFPTSAGTLQRNNAGLVDGFVAKLNPAGSALVYSTLFGGNLVDQALSLAIDDAFAAKINAAGTQAGYFRLLGGFEADLCSGIAVDAQGAAALAARR